jgi:predicted nucleotidyltransferase
MKKIVRMVFGSHMYGLDTPDSDIDYKGIYLPDLDELLLGTASKNISHSTGDNLSRNGAGDIDDDWYSLGEFMKLAMKGETMALDMLHVNPDLVAVELDPEYGWIWEELVANRELFYTKNLNAYMGYVKKQAAKYGLKGSRIAAMREAVVCLSAMAEVMNADLTPIRDVWSTLPENEFAQKITKVNEKTEQESKFYEVNMKKYQDTNTIAYTLERIQLALDSYGERALMAEKNEGVDWKALSHSLRAGYQLRDVFKENTFTYPLVQTDFLLNVKLGWCDYKTEVSPALEDLIEEINGLVAINEFGFPTKIDKKYWDKWLLSVYKTALFEK